MSYSALLDRVTWYIEAILAGLLVVLGMLGVIDVVISLVEVARDPGFVTPEGIVQVIDTVLIVFIVIELIRIAVAYMNHQNVVGTVLEAGLVAVVRKLVVFELGAEALEKAAAIAILVLALGITWYLLRRVLPVGTAVPDATEHETHVA